MNLAIRASAVAVVLAASVFATAASADSTTSAVRIHSAWTADDDGARSDAYLHVEHTRLEAGPIEADWQSAMWTIEPVRGTRFVRLRNNWQPERYIHTENGKVKAGAIEPDWHSAMWELVRVPGTDAVWIRNRWKPEHYLHVQRGKLAAGKINSEWHSARWHVTRI
jgi:hypothetical protein